MQIAFQMSYTLYNIKFIALSEFEVEVFVKFCKIYKINTMYALYAYNLIKMYI